MRGASEVPWRLRRGVERFDRWRRTRERGTRIPRGLWTLAAKLAATYGVCQTASALRLDYYGLKRRVAERAAPALARCSTEEPAFVELPAAMVAAPGECVIDFENARGERMRVHLKGVAAPDLTALSRSFWSDE